MGEGRDAARPRDARLEEGAAHRGAGMRDRALAVEIHDLGVRIAEPGGDDAGEQHGLARARRTEEQRVTEIAVVQVDVDVLAGPRARLQQRRRARGQPGRGAGRVAAPDGPDRHQVRHRLGPEDRAAGIHLRMAGQGRQERGHRVRALLAKAVVPVIGRGP